MFHMIQLSLPIILIDTREQRPYEYDATADGVTTLRRKLDAGDYSISGAEAYIAIERKSIDDWVSTITHARERFNEELKKLRALDRAYIVVEAGWDDVYEGRYARSITNPPRAVISRTIAIMSRYRIPVIFAGDRPTARDVVKDILLDYWRFRLPALRAKEEGGDTHE